MIFAASRDSPAPSPRPLVELLTLAAPTIAQMASYTVMQFTDAWMLSRVGDVEATAGGLGGFVAFTFISLGVGVLLVVNTLVSQAYGRGDEPACGRYLWQGIWFGLLAGLVVLPLLPLAPRLFGALGHEPALARLEVGYMRITLGAAAVKLMSMAAGQFLLAVNRPNLVLIAAAAGAVANVGANWVLIYGRLGFPAMGVDGAAWGTNIGVAVEAGLVAAFAFRGVIARRYHTGNWRLRPAMMRTLLAVGIPSGAQVVADVVAWGVFSLWLIGTFGTSAMAANNFMFQYMKVSFMPAFGLSAAVTALVGRYIGRGQPELAVRRAHLGFVVTAVYMISCGAVFLFARRWLMAVFTDAPDVARMGATMLIFAAVYQVFDAMYLIYNGALRGAGDTFVPAVAVAVLCWTVTVGGGTLMAHRFPHLGILGPWLAATVYGIVLGVFLMVRFMRGGWRRIRLDRPGEAARLGSAASAAADPA